MSRKQKDLRATAFHEAGHAVVAIARGILLSGSCTIAADHNDNAAGSVETEGVGSPQFDDDHAVMLYAGHAAELLHDPKASAAFAQSDYELAAEVVPEPARQQIAQQQAAELVQMRRPQIEAVAEALIQHRTLQGDEVQVVVDAVDAGDDWQQALSGYLELKGRGRATLYHRTPGPTARKIMAEGFRSGRGTYMMGTTLRGTFVSNRPVDVNEGASGSALLSIEIDVARIAKYELVEDGKPYREWCVPASILNRYGKVRMLEPGDENEPPKADNLVPRRRTASK